MTIKRVNSPTVFKASCWECDNCCALAWVAACPDNCKTCTKDASGGLKCLPGACDDESFFDSTSGTCVCTSCRFFCLYFVHFTFT